MRRKDAEENAETQRGTQRREGEQMRLSVYKKSLRLISR